MKKYYLIPVYEKCIYFGGKSLYDITKSYPELIDRENERISILYSTSPLVEMPYSEKLRYKKHNIETDMLFDSLGLPRYIVGYSDDSSIRELVTKKSFDYDYPAAIGVREVNSKVIEDYLESDYETKINNFINTKGKSKRSKFLGKLLKNKTTKL